MLARTTRPPSARQTKNSIFFSFCQRSFIYIFTIGHTVNLRCLANQHSLCAPSGWALVSAAWLVLLRSRTLLKQNGFYLRLPQVGLCFILQSPAWYKRREWVSGFRNERGRYNRGVQITIDGDIVHQLVNGRFILPGTRIDERDSRVAFCSALQFQNDSIRLRRSHLPLPHSAQIRLPRRSRWFHPPPQPSSCSQSSGCLPG